MNYFILPVIYMKLLNRIISIFLIGLSIFICWASVKLGIGEVRNPGTGLMPFLTSSLLFFLSMVVLVKSLIEKDEGGEKKPQTVGGSFQKRFSFVVALSAYTFLLNIFGYLITTFFLISLVLFIFDPNLKNWWKYLVIGAITANLSFLIFCKWFQVQLPIGVFRIGF